MPWLAESDRGGCGGGSGYDILYVPNRLGTTVFWNPNVTTDQNGKATVSIPLPNTVGNLRILVTASSDTTALSQTQTSIVVK